MIGLYLLGWSGSDFFPARLAIIIIVYYCILLLLLLLYIGKASMAMQEKVERPAGRHKAKDLLK